jgi:hypothetical protein
VLSWLENTPFAAWERGESLWGWPLTLTVHVVGTALAVGLVFIVSLRLLGLFGTIPYRSLTPLFAVVWFAFAVELVSGFVLWMTKPTRYVVDIAFMLKLALIVVGFFLTLQFYRMMTREAPSWEPAGSVSSRQATLAGASLLVWCGVLVAGRLTAHLGALYTG